MFYSYTYPSFLARYLFFFSFFLNKEITGDKLEEENKIREEERKKKGLIDKSKNTLQNKYI